MDVRDCRTVQPTFPLATTKKIFCLQPGKLASSSEGFNIQIDIPSMAPAQLLNFTSQKKFKFMSYLQLGCRCWIFNTKLLTWIHSLNDRPYTLQHWGMETLFFAIHQKLTARWYWWVMKLLNCYDPQVLWSRGFPKMKYRLTQSHKSTLNDNN